MVDQRLEELTRWAHQVIPEAVLEISAASADASFRRYFRAMTDTMSYIIMDAPPELEPLAPFIAADEALAAQDVHVPEIYARDIERGFLLLEDLGQRTYLDELSDHAATLYPAAISALVKIQLGSMRQPEVAWPQYSATQLTTEMNLFDAWYLSRHLQITPTADQQQRIIDLKQILIDECHLQPQVWVHRDYHSRNLMVVAEQNPGVIDFQDIMLGPLAYDVASLFKDCYIRWPREQQLRWCEAYLNEVHELIPGVAPDLQQFIRWFDFTGLQRHLKVLGIFCRLCYRDGKTQYLQDLPMVADYVTEVLPLYPEFELFKEFFSALPTPATTVVMP